MKNLDLLPISNENKERLSVGARLYQQHAHLIIEIVSFENNRIIVRAEQKDRADKKLLNKKEIVERVRELFKGWVPDEWKLTVSAVDFNRRDIDAVNFEWIKRRMSNLGLRNKQLTTYTGIDKCTISSILNGEKELTKWHKTAFYYFFKYYDAAQFA
jgi:hypothetical protein